MKWTLLECCNSEAEFRSYLTWSDSKEAQDRRRSNLEEAKWEEMSNG